MNNAVTALSDATQRLGGISDTPRLDAELLLAHALKMERGDMLLRLRDLAVPDGYAALIQRRAAHEPVAYIIGQQDFWDLTLDVSPAVLIPRGDSETLIEAARDFFAANKPLLFRGGGGVGLQPQKPHPAATSEQTRKSHCPSPKGEGLGPYRILDLGTGSGALLLAALSLFPDATGIGVDASPAALSVASGNVAKLGFADRSQCVEASWHDAGWGDALGQFDLILCNPPYVETTAELAPQVRDHEPASALFAGKDGMDDYRILIPQIPALLAPGGVAIFEIGKHQHDAVSNLAISAGLNVNMHKDLADIIRALSFTKKASG